jgi:hypothetical protein
VAAFIVAALFGGTPAPSPPLCRSPCIECGTMGDEAPVCEIHRDENGNVFVLIDGMKIAERGLPGTAQADTWIMLKPGWMVRDVKGGTAIQVSYEHAWMH